MEIGRQIRWHRARLGLSQEDLAASVFVSRQTVSNWETDKTYPDIQSLLLLSDRFGTSVDDLRKGDVEAMEEALDNDWKKMEQLALLGWAFVAVGLVALGVGTQLGGESTLVPGVREGTVVGGALFAVLFVAGLVCLGLVDRYKAKNDLVTYRELVAYSKGETPVRDAGSFGRRHPVASKLLMAAGAAVFGAIASFVVLGVAKLLGL